MDEEVFNLSIRKFLKVVGIGSQREIERAVAQALADGGIASPSRTRHAGSRCAASPTATVFRRA